MKFFVGNLNYRLSDRELATALTEAGLQVQEVTIVTDRESGQSRGFGFFVESSGRAEDEIMRLASIYVAGRPLRIELAAKQQDRPSRPARVGSRPRPTYNEEWGEHEPRRRRAR